MLPRIIPNQPPKEVTSPQGSQTGSEFLGPSGRLSQGVQLGIDLRRKGIVLAGMIGSDGRLIGIGVKYIYMHTIVYTMFIHFFFHRLLRSSAIAEGECASSLLWSDEGVSAAYMINKLRFTSPFHRLGRLE